MQKQVDIPTIRLGEIILFVLFIFWHTCAPAQDRDTAAQHSLSATLFRPANIEAEDATYRNYFGSQDLNIVRAYQSRWNYHESQIRYAATQWQQDQVTIRSPEAISGKGTYESLVRNEFAQQVLRMRIESAINNYLASQQAAPPLRRAHKVVTGMRHQTIAVSSGGKPKGEFQVGYDVMSDGAKFGYRTGAFQASLYQPKLVSNLLASSISTQSLAIQLSTQLYEEWPEASLSFSPGGSYVQTGLTKALSPTVVGQFITLHPVNRWTNPTSYQMNLIYTF